MLRIKLSTSTPDQHTLLRQSPGRQGVWGDCQFLVNEQIDECDAWVVFEALGAPETTRCPINKTILITGEPPDIRTYRESFVSQFAAVVTCQPGICHPNVNYQQQAIPWHAGIDRSLNNAIVHDYDSFSQWPCHPKRKLVSVVCSQKEMAPGHKLRTDFVRKLATRLGGQLDVFGHGHRSIGDKWAALADYRYHLVVENSRLDNYWTEKLADAYLGWCYPIYYGCPNLGDYFPSDAYSAIDIQDADAACCIVERVVASDLHSQRQSQIEIARNLVLNRYNLLPMLAQWVSSQPSACRRKQTIVSERYFAPQRAKRPSWKVWRHLPRFSRAKPSR